MWLPTLVLAGWAAAYLHTVYETLLAPGVPIEIPYEAVGGKYIFRADSYSFNPKSKQLRITRGRLQDPKGQVIAQIAHAEGRLDGGVYVVSARSLWLSVDRTQASRFSLQDALPKPKEGPASAFRFELDGATVEYRDKSLVSRWRADRVRAEGDSDNFVANADLADSHGAALDAKLQYSVKSGADAELKIRSANVASLLPHIPRWVDAGEFAPLARALGAQGIVNVRIPTAGATSIRGQLKGSMTELSLGSKPPISGPYTVTFDENRATVNTPQLTSGALTTSFKGGLSWAKGVKVVGLVDARVPGPSALRPWVKSDLGVDFAGAQFKGRFGLDGTRWLADGDLKVDRVVAQGERAQAISGRVVASEAGVHARGLKAMVQNLPVTAAFDYTTKTSALKGFARAANVSAKQLGIDGLQGSGPVLVALAGTTRKPNIDLQAGGKYTWIGDTKRFVLGELDFRARVTGNQLAVQRAVLSGPHGAYIATGTADLKARSLKLSVKGGGADLKSFHPDLTGLAFMEGTVGGTFSNPSFAGIIEGFGVGAGGREVPVLTAKVAGNAERVSLTEVVAQSGSSKLTGAATLALKTGQLSGTLSGDDIVASDWLHPDLTGTLSFPPAQLSGTLANPKAIVKLTGQKLAYEHLRIDSATGELELKDSKVFFKDLLAQIGGGSAKLSGVHNFKEGFLNLTGELKDVDVAALAPPTEGITLSGKVSGKTQLGGTLGQGLPKGQGQLNLDQLALNGIRLGSGTARLGHSGDRYVGSLELGEDDRFIVGEGLEWNQKSKVIAGSLDVFNFNLAPVAKQVQQRLTPEQSQFATLLEDFKGKATFSVKASGTSEEPVARLNQLEATIANFGGRPAGTITGTGTYAKDVLDLDQLAWRMGESTVLFKGGLGKEGFSRDSDLEINNFDLEKLSIFQPDLARVDGRLTLSATASGRYDNPSAQAGGRLSLRTGNKTGLGKSPADTHYDADFLYNLEVANKKIALDGGYSAEGFSGKLTGQVPFHTLGMGEKGQDALSLTATLDERPIKDFASLLTTLDAERSSGAVGGKLSLTQSSKGYELGGDLHLKGKTLALQGIDTALTDYEVSIKPKGDDIAVEAKGLSSEGGGFLAQLTANIAQLMQSSERVSTIQQALELCGLQGTLQTTSPLAVVVNPNKAAERAAAKIDAQVNLGGNLRNPTIGGKIQALGLDSPIFAPPGGSGAYTFPIDPIFEKLAFGIGDIARVRTLNGNAMVLGSGTLEGRLSAPSASALFTLQGGTFLLPNARVTLIPGGTMKLLYLSGAAVPMLGNADAIARLDVDLEGRTAVSVRRQSDVYERYDVNLDFSGNMLAEGGLKIAATSDPGDLTQDEIMAVLGQRELVEQITGQIQNSSNRQNQLTNTAYQFLFPNVAAGITDRLAQGLKLDSITLDYNSFENTSVSASKTLGPGLTLTMRRQLYETAFARNRYDLRISYRLRSRSKDLSRLRFTLGFNQDVPWRFSMDYSFRF